MVAGRAWAHWVCPMSSGWNFNGREYGAGSEQGLAQPGTKGEFDHV